MDNSKACSDERVLLCTTTGEWPVTGKLFAVSRDFVERFLRLPHFSTSSSFDEFMENYSWLESHEIYQRAKMTGSLLSEMPI